MSKFVIALYEDAGMIDGEQYDTLEEANSVAVKILKELQDDTSKNIDDYDDEISGNLCDENEDIDTLTVLEVTPAVFPNFGYMVFDGLENYGISEGNPDEEWPEATNKDVDELNELVANWMRNKGYTPNWYNIGKTYLVSVED